MAGPNKALLQAGYDVIVIFPPGVALRYFTWRNLKQRPWLPEAGHDVIVISPPGGASRYCTWRILKGRHRLYIHVQLILFVYLERFRRYSTCCIWLGFPYWGAKFWGFLGKMTPKTSNERKTLAGRALSYAKLRLLSHCAWNYLFPFALYMCARKKGRQEGRKEDKLQEKYISRMCGATPSGRNPTKLGTCVCHGRNQTCKVSSLLLEMFRSCKVLTFPCCHREPRPSLTLC